MLFFLFPFSFTHAAGTETLLYPGIFKDHPPIEIEFEAEEIELISTPLLDDKEKNRQLVAIEFKDTPRMVPIVRCESNFTQFFQGKPLISETSDVGVMQINQVHWARALKLGLDVFHSVEDNIAMGKIILKEQGIGAWTCNRLV